MSQVNKLGRDFIGWTLEDDKRFTAVMDRPENFPAVLEGEYRLGGRRRDPAEGGFTFRYVLRSFAELCWVLDHCFPKLPSITRMPGDVFANLSRSPSNWAGGCLDDESSFDWRLTKPAGEETRATG